MSAVQHSPADDAEDHFQRCRDLWLRYMKRPDKPRWYPSKAAVCGRSSSSLVREDDKEIVYGRMDRTIIHAFDACVDSLTVQQRWAVYKAHGLGNPFRFDRVDYEATLTAGMMELRRLVKVRC